MQLPFVPAPTADSVAVASRARTGPGLALAAALGLVGAAPAQITTSSIQLVPPLPNNTCNANPRPSPVPLENYRLTVGDLNGDGVPDLVFSNAAAFCRVYFLEDQGGSLVVIGHDDVIPYLPSCSTTGAGARNLTVSPWSIDSAIVYDIDLDGVNELVYLEHIPSATGQGSIHLRVHRLSANSKTDLVPDAHAVPPASASLTTLMAGGQYFRTSCTPVACGDSSIDQKGGRSFFMKVVNVRGRTYPQDILVWTHNAVNNKALMVFGYDSNPGGTPSLVRLFEHATVGTNPVEIAGSPGHTWSSVDIDYDGREEIIGRHVITWDPVTQTKQVRWGVSLKADPANASVSLDNHPDCVAGVDLIANYFAPNGSLVPSPGREVVIAPQTGALPNAPDASGPMVYRSITGHQFGTPQSPAEWPRKILNINSTGDGAEHWFPSSSATGWQQPSPNSNWNALGNALAGNGIENKGPNAQSLLPVDIVYVMDPITGKEISPGLELLVTSKASLAGVGNGGCTQVGQLHYLFGTGPELQALGWEQSTGTQHLGPSMWGMFPVDFHGTRDAVEIHSLTGVSCGGTPRHNMFRWQLHPNFGPGQAKKVQPVIDWNLAPGSPAVEKLAMLDGTAGRDLFGDSREELMLLRNYSLLGNGSFANSELLVVRDTQPVSRPEPSPWRFLDYRKRTESNTNEPLDYKSLAGLRFHTTHLPRGLAGSAYGYPQDTRLVQNVPGQPAGFGIVAEGGVAPYTFTVTGGAIPAGLTATPIAANGALSGTYFLHGTPTTAGVRNFTLRVTDSASPPQTVSQTFWITVASSPTALPDPRPRITAGGFSGAYLLAGTPAQVNVVAFVSDANNDVVGVSVLDEAGAVIGSLTQTTATRWDGQVTVPALAAGADLHLRMVAHDAALNVSTTWPHLAVEGGPGYGRPVYPTEPPNGQPQSRTPLIDRVATTVSTIEAAEISDFAGGVGVTVHVADRKNMTVDLVEVRLVHPMTGVAVDAYTKSLVPTNGTLNQYTINYRPTASHIGWGEYALQARIRVTNGTASFVSDWWPGLVAH